MKRARVVVLALALSSGAWGEGRAPSVNDPLVWVPALAALGFASTSADDDFSRWARRDSPLFGGTDRARRASDIFLGAGLGLAFGSAWLIPPGERAWNSRVTALAATGATVFVLKRLTGRPRPDCSDDLSFPSGHAALAFAGAALIQDTLARSSLALAPRRVLGLAAWGMAGATAWARVEAGVHYPSDILVGAALGRMVARFSLAEIEVGVAWDGISGPAWTFRYPWR